MGDLISRSALLEKAIKERRFVFQMCDEITDEVIIRTVYKDLAEFLNEAPAINAYTAHEVAEIIAEILGDPCACNFNSIDDWLPFKCELLDACPNTAGVACWEQYLKFRRERE